MSLLTVENLSHTFGDRTLFKDVSFRLLAEDHVGLVGGKWSRKISPYEHHDKTTDT